MKRYLPTLLIGLFLLSIAKESKAQDKRNDALYTMSGLGFSFPLGESATYLKPKFSTSIGLNVALGKSGLFLYPKVSLHAYGYNELAPEQGYTHALKKGRSTTYLLNMALGYRQVSGKFSYYGFVGAGGGAVLTPRIAVNNTTLQAELNNKTNGMAILETGIGLEYNLGKALFFVEGSYMHGFKEIQNRKFNAAPLAVGIKPNLSQLFKRKQKNN